MTAACNQALERIFRFFQFNLLAKHPWPGAVTETPEALLAALENRFSDDLHAMEI